MEKTIENKAKFFAQYWGQVMIDHNGSVNIWNGLFDLRGCCLELTPLSSIADEDAIEVAKIVYADTEGGRKLWTPDNGKEHIDMVVGFGNHFRYYVTDYLRSKGYALPYMGIEVETLIEWGWIKLKE